MTSVIFGQVFRWNLCWTWLWDDYCEGGACDTHGVVRTGDRSGDSDESDKEDIYQVSWEAGFRSWWQNLLPRRSSEGKQRRNFVGELGGATCTYSCLLTRHSLCHVDVRSAWKGYLGFSFSFPVYLEWQRPFRAKLRVKKSLWKEILLILLWEFVGVQREFKGRLKDDCNTLMNLSLSLSFQFPCYSFLELSLMLQLTFFACLFLFLFEHTCSHLEDWRTSWSLALFPPLSWMSMQPPEIAQMYSLFFF